MVLPFSMLTLFEPLRRADWWLVSWAFILQFYIYNTHILYIYIFMGWFCIVFCLNLWAPKLPLDFSRECSKVTSWYLPPPALVFVVLGSNISEYICPEISVCMCSYLTCRYYPSKSTVLGFPVCDPSVSHQFSQLPGEQKPERESMYGNIWPHLYPWNHSSHMQGGNKML